VGEVLLSYRKNLPVLGESFGRSLLTLKGTIESAGNCPVILPRKLR
jgi:hypothetical protein